MSAQGDRRRPDDDDAAGAARFVTSASFAIPEAFVRSAWIEHAPFAFWIVEALRPRRLVELGTYAGFSYLVFCQAVRRAALDTACFAIDTWEGDDHAGRYGPKVLRRLRRRHDRRYGAFSRLIRSTFDRANPDFADRSIDLLHIDGFHTYEAVKHDFETWLPKLSDRAVVLFHDTDVRETDFGVFRLWEELQTQFPSFEFRHGYGLGVLGVGRDLPKPLTDLFEAARDPEEAETIALIYAGLGAADVVRAAERRRTARNFLAKLRRGFRPNPVTRAWRWATRLTGAPPALRALRVLIVGILVMPQCAKYRVWQKKAMLESLGCACTVFDWTDIGRAREALASHDIVVFYRVRAEPWHIALAAEARRRGLITVAEIDDTIFDRAIYRANRNLEHASPGLRESVLADTPHYRAMLAVCQYAIASTRSLGRALHEAGAADVHLVENGLDEETVRIAAGVRAARGAQMPDGIIRIIYGSGSDTHDADFEVAAEALALTLKSHPQVRLCLAGYPKVPPALAEWSDRIERHAFMDFAAWLALLGRCDINIVPLVDNAFNDAKSNIKYIEAAMVEIPSACSPREPYASIIDHGRNGFLAETTVEWQTALERLVIDAERRRQMGAAARRTVEARYAADSIAAAELAPMLKEFAGRRGG
jgi:glycosyltransferase involved in cell wall biosynthesis